MRPLRDIPRELAGLTRDFNVAALANREVQSRMRESLQRTGRLRQRRSPLQPMLVMWLVLGMTLFRYDSIPAVLSRLLTGLRARLPSLSLRPVTDGALAHARQRLGVPPVREFFLAQAAAVQPEPSFHGLRLWSLDGSLLTMPDTEANRKVFGVLKVPRGQAAFPQLRWVGLQDAVSRQFRAIVFRRWDAAERRAAVPLLKHLGSQDLLLLDRGFYGVWLLAEVRRQGTHFLVRVPESVQLRPVQGTRRRDGDYLAQIQARVPLPAGETRKPLTGRPGQTQVVSLLVRVIEYRIPGFRPVRLATSLLDAKQIPALDLALAYHERWEVEIGLDEIKTHQSSHAGGALETEFRSKTPRGVMQEAYALFSSYNMVRATMQAAAAAHHLSPQHLSFMDTLRVISHMLPRMMGAKGARYQALYDQLLRDIAECRLDRPRRPRRYPRVVKVKMSNYKLKRADHRQQICDVRQLIKIGR